MDCAKADMHVDVSFPCKSSVVGNIGFQVLFTYVYAAILF